MKHRFLAALALAAVLLAPFHLKPPTVDDALVLTRARAAWTGQPTSYNWFGTADPDIPRASLLEPPAWWWIVGAMGQGEPEKLDRFCMLPFLALALFCTAELAARAGAPPLPTMLLAGLSPLLWIPAATWAADLPTLSLGLLALLLLSGKRRRPVAGAAALFAAGSMKFTVAPIYVPALLANPLATLAAGAATLVWPAAVIAGKLQQNAAPVSSFLLTSWKLAWHPVPLLYKTAYGLAALSGAAAFPAVFWTLFLARRRKPKYASVLAGAAALLSPLLIFAALKFRSVGFIPSLTLWHGTGFFTAIWFALGLAGFIAWLGSVVLEQARRRDGAATLLLAWLGAVFAALLLGSPFPAGRFVVMAVPPIAILVIRDLGRHMPKAVLPWTRAALLVSTAWLGFNLSFADDLFARCSANLAEGAVIRYRSMGRRVLTTGHWGFQLAVERAGGEILEQQTTKLRPGDVLLVPLNTFHHTLGPAGSGLAKKRLADYACPVPDLALRTIDAEEFACFYGGNNIFPYSFSSRPLEILLIFEMVEKPR